MAYLVVLDANVLYPFSLRDLLLRLAEQEFFVHIWSGRILDEVARNLVENEQVPAEKVEKLIATMERAFPEAMQDLDAIKSLEADMPNDEGDRHVLATAVVSGAEGIITFNLGDFRDEDLQPLGKQAIHPDDFLCTLHDMLGEALVHVLEDQATALKNPPKSPAELLDLMQLGGVPQFVSRMRAALGLAERSDQEILAERRADQAG